MFDNPASSEASRQLIMRGRLDEVGLDDLLSALGAKRKSCVVEVRSAGRRGEVVLDRGRVLRARVDGLSAGSDPVAVIGALRMLYRPVFDVLSLDESTGPASGMPASDARPPSRPPPAMLEGDATEVALAAAVMNTCGAYTRKWLGPKIATSILTSAWVRLNTVHPALDAFRISPEGMVSVSGIERAKSAIPRAVAQWVFAVFDAGAASNPARFQRYFVPDVLGGLMRLLDKGGWGDAFREGGMR